MEIFTGRSVCGERKEDGQTMTPFQRFSLFLCCPSVRRESATLQTCSVALFVEPKKGREIGTMRWCVPCTAIRWGAEMRSSKKLWCSSWQRVRMPRSAVSELVHHAVEPGRNGACRMRNQAARRCPNQRRPNPDFWTFYFVVTINFYIFAKP